MRAALIALLAVLALAAPADAATQRLVFPTLQGEYHLAFDDNLAVLQRRYEDVDPGRRREPAPRPRTATVLGAA